MSKTKQPLTLKSIIENITEQRLKNEEITINKNIDEYLRNQNIHIDNLLQMIDEQTQNVACIITSNVRDAIDKQKKDKYVIPNKYRKEIDKLCHKFFVKNFVKKFYKDIYVEDYIDTLDLLSRLNFDAMDGLDHEYMDMIDNIYCDYVGNKLMEYETKFKKNVVITKNSITFNF